MSGKRAKKNRRKKVVEPIPAERRLVYEADVDPRYKYHEFLTHMLLLSFEDADVQFDEEGNPVSLHIDFKEDSRKAFNYLRGSMREYKTMVHKLNPLFSWAEVMADLKNILSNYEERIAQAEKEKKGKGH